MQTLATWHQPRRASADVHYGYDARGRQLFARFGSASGQGVSNTWDGFGQMLTSSTNLGGVARTFGYEYDAAGNRIRITHPDLNYFTTNYDGLNRATAILENGSATLVTIAYDALGRRTSLTRPGAGTTTYAYDGASRLQSLGHDFSGTTNDATFTFGFNPVSQILSRANSNDLFVFTGSLPGAATSTINGLSQVAVHNGTTFTHDANGNLTWDGARTYAYDVENRLVSTTGDVNAALTYDPLGRLASYGTSTQNFYLYDGDERIGEYDAAGALVRRYVYGPGVDEPLVAYESPSPAARIFLHADERGSIIARTDAAGAATSINRYDEYGVPASTNTGYHGYTGQLWLPELNLWYYRARIYSSQLGRFLQVDPIGYDDQINLYAYVQNDPVSRYDANGQWHARVHNRILNEAVGDRVTWRGREFMYRRSMYQDNPYWGNGKYNHMHFLRNPGQNPQEAHDMFTAYLANQVSVGRAAWGRGDEAGALRAFTNAAHALADSYSPVHRDTNGQPAVYDPDWNVLEAWNVGTRYLTVVSYRTVARG